MTALSFIQSYRKLTPTLKKLIVHCEKTMNTQSFEKVCAAIGELVEQTEVRLGRIKKGELRAREVISLVENEIASHKDDVISCKKGCGYCCNFEVEVTDDEAVILANVVENGFAIDFAKLALQASRKPGAPEWQLGVHPSNTCVFLGADQACSIYEDRPATCRKHAVTSPAELCKDVTVEPTTRNLPVVDIILSAAVDFSETSTGSLAKMLYHELLVREKVRQGEQAI